MNWRFRDGFTVGSLLWMGVYIYEYHEKYIFATGIFVLALIGVWREYYRNKDEKEKDKYRREINEQDTNS